MGTTNVESEGTRITFERVFAAPRMRVWEAWTKAEAIARWWGPAGLTTRVEEHDLRVGGKWRYVMVDPDGNEYPSEGVFQEVVVGERLVTSDAFGEDFEPPPGETLPEGMRMTVLFEDHPEGTKLTIIGDHASVEDREKIEKMGAVEGWRSQLDCLDEYLAEVKERGDGSDD